MAMNTTTLTEKNIKKQLKEQNCTRTRVLKEGEMYTMEYDDSRLNFIVDNDNKIVRTWKG